MELMENLKLSASECKEIAMGHIVRVRFVFRPLNVVCAVLLVCVVLNSEARAEAPPPTIEPTRTLEVPREVLTVTFGTGGKTVLASNGKTIHVFDTTSGKEVASVKSDDMVGSLALSPDEKMVACGAESPTVSLLDPLTGKRVRTLDLNTAPYAVSVAWSPDGKKLAAVAARDIQIWDVASGKVIANWKGPENVFDLGIAFSPDGTQLLGGRSGGGPEMMAGSVYLWDIATGKELAHIATLAATAHRWGCFLDAKTIITPDGGMAGGASSIDIATGKRTRAFTSEVGQTFTSGSLSHDRKLLVTGDASHSTPPVQVWDPATGKLIATLRGLKAGQVKAVAFSPDDKWIVASGDTMVGIWATPKR